MATERTWWEAQRTTWSRPREWTASHLIVLGLLVLILLVMALWVTRPGGVLGGTAPLPAGRLMADDAQGRYVFELFDQPGGSTGRLQATMQREYSASRARSEAPALTLVFIRQNADPAPFVSGTAGASELQSDSVVGWVTANGSTCEAMARPAPDAPQQRVSISC